MFAVDGEVCRRLICIGYHLFDLVFGKVSGHVDGYCPAVIFRVVSFDWGCRSHDVIIGVWTNVCDAPQAFWFASCDVCSMFPIP